MLIANVRLKLDKGGSDVYKENVTPAEALFFVAEHQRNANGNPLTVVSEPTEIDRTSVQEINRLMTRYNPDKIKAIFSSPMANVPATFEEAIEAGAGIELPSTRLTDTKIP